MPFFSFLFTLMVPLVKSLYPPLSVYVRGRGCVTTGCASLLFVLLLGWCVSVFLVLFSAIRPYVVRTPNCSDGRFLGVLGGAGSSSFALYAFAFSPLFVRVVPPPKGVEAPSPGKEGPCFKSLSGP